ncbi:PIN domain-containing protein [Ancylothrix sp. C2]|uniref:type II toxin-antitoxin system VapC family toxin n=1 Tax=Ancylothrix sp. D3o TaxID=2953691 RepID=UPI0021BA9F15|nr:PIN domain-containing protein [Ancylothrix sp. D3o]MCT7948183.1 PIN domain-containing protein [Ancylothrix sp. D3o]
MEWIAQLQGKIVGLDTAPLIYFMEKNPKYIEMMRFFFRAFERGDFRIVTSTVTLVEVLVHPLRQRNTILAQEYREILLNQESLTVVELTPDIAEKAAQLRATYNLRSPDSIQMATAICEGASFFLTNDAWLPSLPELTVIVLDNLRS